MVTDLYGSILQELGSFLHLNIQPDENNSCLLRFKGGVEVQIEIDKHGENLILGADLGQVPLGQYRESLFEEALKYNGLPINRVGSFGFSKRIDHLILFEMLELKDLSGAKVADTLIPLIEKARLWKDAISKGDIPTGAASSRSSGGMFGLKP